MATISLTVNGRSISLDAEPEMPLLWALRDSIGLVGTKFGCGGGFCGACMVHVDGAATRSCTLPLSRAAGHAIVTIEGLASMSGVGRREAGVENALHPVQRAWVDLDVPQCGYCQAGQIMTAAALLAARPEPSDDDIDHALAGNLCRCGSYPRIRAAVHRAAALGGVRGGGRDGAR